MISKLPFYRDGSFGFKILFAFICVIVVILSAFTVADVLQEHEKARRNLQEQGDTLATFLADKVILGVFAENRKMLKGAVDNIIDLKDVVAVSILDAGMKTLYAKERDSSASGAASRPGLTEDAVRDEQSTAVLEHDRFFEFVRPVLIKRGTPRDETLYLGHQSVPGSEKAIGYVRIILSKDSYREEIASIVSRHVFIMLAFIAAGFLIVRFAVKKVTLPLRKLTDNVLAHANGQPVEQIAVESRDEICNLASAFSVMVAARGRAEQSLRESEKKFRMLAETAAAAIFIFNGNSFHYFNSTTEKMTGYSREELQTINFWSIVHPEFEWVIRELTVGERQRTGDTFRCEFKIVTKTGDERWLDCTFGTIEFNGKTASLGTAYDLTPHKKLETQFIQARKMEAVGVLAGELAHDFNNFISAIISYCHMAKTRTDESDPNRYLDLILACSVRAANLTTGLLAFSRKQTINLKPVRLDEVVASVEKLLSPVFEENMTVKTAVTGRDLIVLADAAQLEQMFMNLAANARDAMPDGGVFSITAQKVELDEEFVRINGYGSPGGYALITVSDTGIGMDKRTLDRVFEPFFTTKEIGKGTGLGLSIVYGTVKQHNGYITVSSEPGAGTSFSVYFPVVKTAAATLTEAAEAASLHGTETVLLAEDDQTLRTLTATLLSEAGYTVIEAANGEQAFTKFVESRDRIDLVVLDVMMPLKNGQEVLSEMQKLRPDVRFLFVTGYTHNVIPSVHHTDPGLNILTKPVQPALLLKKIRTALDKAG